MQITAIIPTFNEEKNISKALSSVDFVDEILIIDSYSTDKTLEIINSREVTLLQRKFDDFSNQKNYAINNAKNDWIILLDADEVLTKKLQTEIQEQLKNLSKKEKIVAFKIPRSNFFLNKFLKYGPNGKEKIVRLFNRKFCFYEGIVHESLNVSGKTGSLKHSILHYTYKSFENFLSKKNLYSDFQAQQIVNKQKKINPLKIILKPFFRFNIEIFIKGGILDGLQGIVISKMNSYGVFSRYVKYHNLLNKNTAKELLFLNDYSLELAKKNNTKSLTSIPSNSFTLIFIPLIFFLYHYILKFKFLQGMEGFFLSYLEGFKQFLCLTYKWINKKNIL